MVESRKEEEKEIEKRRDEIARRMLNTPPKPRKPKTGKVAEPHFYVALEGKMYVVPGESPPGPVFTADLYRNPEDFRQGRVCEPGVTLSLD